MGRRTGSAFFQPGKQFLPFLFRKPFRQPNRYRTRFKQPGQNFFRCLRAVIREPHPHNPFRHGVHDRQPENRFFFLIRPHQLFFFPGQAAQHTVHKALQLLKMSLFRQLHRFIAGRRIRDIVHKKDLICAHSQQIAYERLAFCRRRFGKTAQDIIQLNPPLRHAFGQPFDKGLITAFQVIIFIQYILKKKAAILLPFFHFQ